MKIIKYILIYILTVGVSFAGPEKGTSFITGVGTSHFEAHRMAINAANASGMRIRQQISAKSNDGLWHVIIKVNPK